jgi:uncharacterized protein (TIGR00645 family)
MADHHHETPPTPAKATLSRARRAIGILDTAIFSTRWILYPINFGLFCALVVYVFKFMSDDYTLIVHSAALSGEQIMVALVGLVDIAMVANLLIMMIQGNHQIFIRRLEIADARDRPQWLDHIDSGILKVKVALSIVGITLVQLLKDFVNIEHAEWDVTVHRIIIHCIALVSALIVAVIWRITHPQAEAAHHPTA